VFTKPSRRRLAPLQRVQKIRQRRSEPQECGPERFRDQPPVLTCDALARCQAEAVRLAARPRTRRRPRRRDAHGRFFRERQPITAQGPVRVRDEQSELFVRPHALAGREGHSRRGCTWPCGSRDSIKPVYRRPDAVFHRLSAYHSAAQWHHRSPVGTRGEAVSCKEPANIPAGHGFSEILGKPNIQPGIHQRAQYSTARRVREP
jgi:hypothetical protein